MTPTLRAAFWMTGAIFSFTVMAIAGRAVALDLDTFEIMMYRSIVGFVVVVLIARATGTMHQIGRNRMGLYFIRNISHFAGQNLWFYAITVIPLAQVFALEFTSPIWALLMAPLVLQEKLTARKLGIALGGFAGILIVTRPFGGTLEFGLIAAGLAAIGFAGSAVFTRRLTRTESITSILFYLTLMQAVFGLVFAGYDGDIAFPAAASVPWVILIALCGLLAHFCLTTALSLAPASTVMPIDFARLPVIAVVGILLYGEALDPFVFLGGAIIFAAIYLNILDDSRARKAAKPA
jgi:drug/metabolite transporter (DMT)-like permease